MTHLITTPNLPNSDDTYADLLAAHDGLNREETHALNARLVLLLANHIGDPAVLREAFAAARGAVNR